MTTNDYKVVDQDEQDDIVIAFLWEQERDKYCHQINSERYDEILVRLKEGEWKDRISKLHKETIQRLIEVNSIIDATQKQLPSQERIDAAKGRIKLTRGR